MEWMLLPYRRYFEFTGRSRRREYWMFTLLYVLVSVAISVLLGTTQTFRAGFFVSTQLVTSGPGDVVQDVFGLVSFIPGLAVTVRRLHDIDRSGWWFLLVFVPVLGWFTLLIFYCLDGTAGSNRFGPDPKERGVVEVFR